MPLSFILYLNKSEAAASVPDVLPQGFRFQSPRLENFQTRFPHAAQELKCKDARIRGSGESLGSGRGRWAEPPGPEPEGKDAHCGGGRGLFLLCAQLTGDL